MFWIERFPMTYHNTIDGRIVGFRGEFDICQWFVFLYSFTFFLTSLDIFCLFLGNYVVRMLSFCNWCKRMIYVVAHVSRTWLIFSGSFSVGIFSFETTTPRCAGLSFRVATFQRYTQQFHHLTKIVVIAICVFICYHFYIFNSKELKC